LFSSEYKFHYKESIKLAYPVIIGSAAHMMASVADSIMVGQISATQLAAASFANGAFFLIFIFGIGVAVGLTPLIGKAYGKRQVKECAELFRNSFYLNALLGIMLTLLAIGFAEFFPYMDQPPEVVEYAKPYYYLLAFSLIPQMIFLSFKQFTEGMQLTKPAMIVGIFCNLVNVFLNWLFIYGNWEMPRLELVGAGVATLLSRILMAVSFAFVFYKSPKLRVYLSKLVDLRLSLEQIKSLMRLGLPIGLQLVLEVGAFVAATFMIGWMGEIPLASHQIAINLASITFLMATGLATAATIRISNYAGKEKYREMKMAGNAAYVLVTIFMTVTAIIFITIGDILAGFYVQDTEVEVIRLATALLVIGGLFQIADGAQAVGLAVLRGVEDVKIPTIIASISYWVICIPLCYFLGNYLGYGAEGVWFGLCVGLGIVAITLFFRFNYINKQLAMKS